MTPEEFRRIGHQIVDWVADYRATIGDRPVMAPCAPGEIKARLPTSPPAAPESFDAILRDVDDIIMPGISHWQHPAFFGYFPANSSLASVLGDYLSTGLGVIGLSWQSSPALSELEEVTTDWMRQMVGLSSAWSGVIQDTASTSTLVALLSARERTTSYGLVRGGLQAEARPLVVYVSAHSHSSVEKAALLAGFGRDNLRVVAHDAEFAMRADALAQAIAADVAAGRTPCAVVATTGTTTTTALDPVAAIAEVASAHHLLDLLAFSGRHGGHLFLHLCHALFELAVLRLHLETVLPQAGRLGLGEHVQGAEHQGGGEQGGVELHHGASRVAMVSRSLRRRPAHRAITLATPESRNRVTRTGGPATVNVMRAV